MLGTRLDLLSKMSNKDAQIISLIAVIRPPDRLKQFPMGYGFSSLRDEVTEQVELFRCQANVPLAGPNLSGFEIDFEIAGHECFRAGG